MTPVSAIGGLLLVAHTKTTCGDMWAYLETWLLLFVRSLEKGATLSTRLTRTLVLLPRSYLAVRTYFLFASLAPPVVLWVIFFGTAGRTWTYEKLGTWAKVRHSLLDYT